MKIFFLINFTLLYCISFYLQASSPNPPDNLRTCDKTNPVGTGDKPYFGWYINDPDNNEIQTAYQIIVASNLDDITANKGTDVREEIFRKIVSMDMVLLELHQEETSLEDIFRKLTT